MASLIWYDNTEAGAPVLNNVAGSLVEVLRSCLVTGFNSKTVASISVAAGVATVSCTAHGFTTTYQKLVSIDGCSEALLNGQKQPTSVATNSFTFSVVGVADGTYGGTITAKRTPLGWTEEYTVANGAIFKRSDVTATANMLRVLDTKTAPATTTSAQVFMVESATDFNTYTNRVPTSDTYGAWSRGQDTATAQKWVIVGDGKRAYVMTSNATPTNYTGVHTYFFGDAEPITNPDPYACFFIGHTNLNMSTTNSGLFSTFMSTVTTYNASASSGCFCARNKSGSTVQVPLNWYGTQIPYDTGYNSPATTTNLLMGPQYLADNDGFRLRFPIYAATTYQPHNHLTIVQPDNVSGRFLAIEANGGASTAANTIRAYIPLDDW